jgi:hypothetical protein
MKSQLKHSSYLCPVCFFEFTPDSIVEYTDKYIKCPSPYCTAVYIPRAKDARTTLVELLDEHRIPLLSCVQCCREYIAECVPHTDQFSLCPSCCFPNPHCEFARDYMDRCFNGGMNTHVCEDCGNRYDSSHYEVLDTESEYPYCPVLGDQCYVCGECLAKHPTYVQSIVCYECSLHYGVTKCKHTYGCGDLCRLTKLEDYPTIELCDAVHQFTMDYLPVAEYKFMDQIKQTPAHCS